MQQFTELKCPFSSEPCDLARNTSPAYDVVTSSVGGPGVVGLELGTTTRLADLAKGNCCPRQGLEGTVKVGDRVPVVTDMAGVATRIGPTATTPCVQLNPWR